MARAMQERPEVPGESEVSAFSAHVYSDSSGKGFLSAEVKRTFSSSEELRRWLHVCADQLALDIDRKNR